MRKGEIVLLEKKIKNKAAKIGVIGLGYVGLPLALEFAKTGFKVTGFDIDAEKVRKANRGESYIKDIKGARIMIIGATYKRDVDDIRESPALDIMENLIKKGARIFYNDPFVCRLNLDIHKFKSQPLTPKTLNSMDCVVIVTDHSIYDYKMIVRYSKLILDTRNATKGIKSGKIVRL